jgi:pyrroline-5-carboxylate reductase
MDTHVAVLGAGMLGESLLSGLLAAGTAPEAILITEKQPERAGALAKKYGVAVVDNAEAASRAQVLLLAVKPQDVPALVREIGPKLESTAGQLVVSLAAGVLISTLEADLPLRTPVVRVMTNTPVRVREAMSALAPGTHARSEHLDLADELLRAVGRTVRVTESQLDAVTALSGSGPAYFFYLVEAMVDAGVLLGLPRTVATELIVQTAYGSASILRESGEHPVTLREAVSSPGGTTVAAIRELENHGVRAAILAALQAAADRSKELGRS